MQDIETFLRLVLMVVLIFGLVFIFIYLALTLKNLSSILGNVKHVTQRVDNVTADPEKMKEAIQDFALSTVDKVVDKQVDRLKIFVSNNILGTLLKILGR